MSKITNPVVLIHKRENSDTYAVAITSGSQDYHDAVLMATMEPDMTGDDVDTWSKTGYYMATEIERLKQALSSAESNLIDSECHVAELISNRDRANGLIDTYDWQRQRLHEAAEKVIKWCRQEAEHRTGDPDKAENYACVKELRDALTFCESSGGIGKKTLTISLPDITSKAFWSDIGKSEVFHPETYKRWAKEAIERACVIAGIGVEVK
ncbi:Uncharacterised protein [Citrobacter werkmanii]|uniref:Ead/Ea22-like family protein n=1 Tax=Citrobacter werkmanii TaxID=67827 RepID=A0A9N8GQK4_9ENTR|nr:Uncharacterised protein [Citrobacter werkmanii]CAB5527860.1 Uncharacterised protein [Citrobacter werkmanii]CAB5530997.1 Uncharacterised protein [Citrobacter werkmanii]CAB5531803.1 Uncharacterised protein [Citrobacter werkmanii]CAB5535842.1 Uncharacterised protein [Citrobacter werkmanii]